MFKTAPDCKMESNWFLISTMSNDVPDKEKYQ